MILSAYDIYVISYKDGLYKLYKSGGLHYVIVTEVEYLDMNTIRMIVYHIIIIMCVMKTN